jgi:hypothetical protein
MRKLFIYKLVSINTVTGTFVTEGESYFMDDEDSTQLGQGGMLDRSRVALCFFVFTLLVINPLGVLLGEQSLSSEVQSMHGGGRMILGSAEDTMGNIYYMLSMLYINRSLDILTHIHCQQWVG